MIEAANKYLDADELMHLALVASRESRNEDAIVYFKRALEIAPNEAGLHYLLGAQYLRIGLNERAVGHIEHALALNPGLDGARFQLGWIYWAHGHVDTASETWKPLDSQGAQHPLYLFKTGLLHLAKQQYDECEDLLRRGIAANRVDVPLNRDMAQILKQLQGRGTSKPSAPRGTETASGGVASSKVEAPSKPAATPKPATPEGATRQEAPVASGKVQASSPKPRTPKNVMLSVYQQNRPEDADNQ